MPNVGGKKFPYTKAGMMAAKRSAVGMEGGGRAMSDADRERASRMMGRSKKAILQGTGNEGAAESQMILKLIQRMAQEEAETGAVKRGNMVAAMEADESGMSDRDMDLINMALGRGVTKSVRPTAMPQGMMYGGKATKRKLQKYGKGGEAKSRGAGCVMAGRGMKKTKMS